jgi:hypothetical protein
MAAGGLRDSERRAARSEGASERASAQKVLVWDSMRSWRRVRTVGGVRCRVPQPGSAAVAIADWLERAHGSTRGRRVSRVEGAGGVGNGRLGTSGVDRHQA